MKPIEHIREAVKLCMLDHLGCSFDKKSVIVNFWKNPETIEVRVKCTIEESLKVRKAFANCWVLNRLKIGKMLTLVNRADTETRS